MSRKMTINDALITGKRFLLPHNIQCFEVEATAENTGLTTDIINLLLLARYFPEMFQCRIELRTPFI